MEKLRTTLTIGWKWLWEVLCLASCSNRASCEVRPGCSRLCTLGSWKPLRMCSLSGWPAPLLDSPRWKVFTYIHPDPLLFQHLYLCTCVIAPCTFGKVLAPSSSVLGAAGRVAWGLAALRIRPMPSCSHRRQGAEAQEKAGAIAAC